MKKIVFLVIAPVVTFLVLISATENKKSEVSEIEIPANIKSIIDNNCYGCHSEKGKSDDAKEALIWDDLNNYEKEKQFSVLDDIVEVIGKGEMPPKKFLEKYPDKTPSDEDYANLMGWADKQATLMGG